MCNDKNKLIKEVECWMKKFYGYSSDNPKAEKYEQFKSLKGILDKHRE